MSDAYHNAYCVRPSPSVIRRAALVRLLLLDVDGVLTDGSIYTGPIGEPCKAFHSHDGKGITMLRAAGLQVGLISARRSESVAQRAQELGIEQCHQGVSDKRGALLEIAQQLGVERAAVAFLGDDLPDLGALGAAGLAACVADAHPHIKANAHWCARRPGGRGAVRELAELLLGANHGLQAELNRHA